MDHGSGGSPDPATGVRRPGAEDERVAAFSPCFHQCLQESRELQGLWGQNARLESPLGYYISVLSLSEFDKLLPVPCFPCLNRQRNLIHKGQNELMCVAWIPQLLEYKNCSVNIIHSRKQIYWASHICPCSALC